MCLSAACSVGWFVSLLVREEVLLTGLCEKKILFRLKIYDRLRQATPKQTDWSLDPLAIETERDLEHNLSAPTAHRTRLLFSRAAAGHVAFTHFPLSQ